MSKEAKKSLENKDSKVDETTVPSASGEEKKPEYPTVDEPTQKNEEGQEDEVVQLSKEEYEKLKKKADDFEGIIAKRRLEKLNKSNEAKNNESSVDPEDIKEIIRESVQSEFQKLNQKMYEENLTQAYKQFISENQWADNDEVISKISEAFNPGDSLTVNHLVNRLKMAAQNTFPEEYEKAQRAKIEKEILAQKNNISAGDISSGVGQSSFVEKDKNQQKSERKFFKKKEPIQEWYKTEQDN